MSASFTPAWFEGLPMFRQGGAARVVIIDNQVLSYRLLDGRSDEVFNFLFQDPRIVLQIGGQTMDETLHSVAVDDTGLEHDRRGRPTRVGPETYRPGLPAALNQRMWEQQGALVAQGKLFLARSMLPAQRLVFDVLAPMIHAACGRRVGPKDARVVADALARRIPLYSLDNRLRDGLAVGLLNQALARELQRLGLDGFAARLFVG
ncbi:hypothetical protein EOD42_15920 [Rhodovarius crocodyli]|uniref:Uncharacterized protein n=1 Tax=Rhodovarius crocodyli TaxID=1979269 RepID=A0A437MDF5_9PROT|nr:hypothetical protein [Rhodovarius crocodyli]RVT95682.1 hypothetical protein EOD42_15920 [Rhodovarius crocodyli]